MTGYCPIDEALPPAAAPALSAAAVTKCFGRTRAVSDVSIELEYGSALGLLGPNGAGKSTMMLLLAGVLRPDSGKISIDGQGDPTRPKVRRRLGYAPQSLALYPELTALENLRLLARLYGLSGSALKEKVAKAMDLAQLRDRASEPVKRFSGGMLRRLNLAAATVHNPRLLLLDEPTVGIDPQSRAHIFCCIEALKRQKVSIVYATHYLEEAERLCDTVAVLDHGRILAQGAPDELVRRFGGASQVEAQLTCAPSNEALSEHWHQGKLSLRTQEPTQFIYQLLAANSNVKELSMRRPNLESVFMNLTGRSMRDG